MLSSLDGVIIPGKKAYDLAGQAVSAIFPHRRTHKLFWKEQADTCRSQDQPGELWMKR